MKDLEEFKGLIRTLDDWELLPALKELSEKIAVIAEEISIRSRD